MKVSTGLRNYMLSDQSLKDALDDGTIRIYSGTVPATADAALSGNTLLCEISDNAQALTGGTGIDFETNASSGVLSKASAQTWSGTNAATGTASFFRHVQQADDGTLSTTAKRIQGTVATAGADLNLQSTSLTSGQLQTIDYYTIALTTL